MAEPPPDQRQYPSLKIAGFGDVNYSATDKPECRARLDLVKRLLAARTAFIIPRLPFLQLGGCSAFADGILTAQWTFVSGETLSLMANLGEQARTRPDRFRNEQPVWGGVPPAELPPWSVYAAIGDP